MTSDDELETSIRRGDVYAVMIQHFVKIGNFSEAKQLCLELRQILSKTDNTLTYYLSKDVIETLAQGLGVPVSHFLPVSQKISISKSNSLADNDGDPIDEIIDE